jgi:spermidine/putrescine transport system ATP-binding protein
MVAHFLGGMNFLSGKAIRSAPDTISVEVEKLGTLPLQKPEGYVSSGDAVTVGIRPEKLRLLGDRDTADFAIAGQVLNTTYFGQSTQILVGVEGLEQPLSVLTPMSEACELSPGSAIRLAYRPEDMVVVVDDTALTRQ